MEGKEGMANIMEKEITKTNGMGMLFLNLASYLVTTAVFVLSIIMLVSGDEEGNTMMMVLGGVLLAVSIVLLIVAIIMSCGFHVINPNEALVLTLFGQYYGTIKKSGFYYTNPFCTAVNPTKGNGGAEITDTVNAALTQGKALVNVSTGVSLSKKISTKVMTFSNERQKVNDVLGNPIIIGAVVIWKVVEPTKAVLNVDNYLSYLSIQSDSTIRNIAKLYPYDDMDENEANTEKTLRGSSQQIAESMKEELQSKVVDAGIEIMEVKITHLSYAEEIAAAMLQRQQATAIIAARQKIVEGAVSMVKMAIDQLSDEEIVVLDEERKAAMVSNLLVVLCGNKEAQPIVNSGSIY